MPAMLAVQRVFGMAMPVLKPLLAALMMALMTATAAVAEACGGTYRIQRGDTLSEIAQMQVGTVFAMHQLIAANPHTIGRNPNVIHVGAVLNLPCRVNPMGEAPVATAMDWTVMPNAREIAALVHAKQTQVLDIRPMDAIYAGVIPGAIHVPYAAWRTPAGMSPNEDMLAEIYGLSGLRLDQPIVIVNSRASVEDTGQAAFVYWLLKSSGADQLAILRNGHQSWINAAGTVLRASRRASPVNVTAAPVQPLLSALSGEVDPSDGVAAILNHLTTFAPGWENGPVIIDRAGRVALVSGLRTGGIAEYAFVPKGDLNLGSDERLTRPLRACEMTWPQIPVSRRHDLTLPCFCCRFCRRPRIRSNQSQFRFAGQSLPRPNALHP